MKIKLNLNIFLFLILFLITNQIQVYALIMIFALLHEIGHLAAGIILGFEADTLKMMPLGFCVGFKTKVQDYNKKIIKSNILSVKKIIIALAGPLVNFFVILICIILKVDNSIIYANFLIIIFNLFPVYPLDGGRILKNILKILLGNRKAIMYTNKLSNTFMIILTITSSILIMKYKNISIFAIIIFLWIIIIKENKRYNIYDKIYKAIDKKYNYL